MSIAATVENEISNMKRFCNFAIAYVKKQNPLIDIKNSTIEFLKDVLTTNKKLKIAKYRVNHLSYRLYQMEQLIEEGSNPKQRKTGKSINIIR